MPLALLAAVGHPDPAVRARVAGLLDDRIADEQPLHADEEVRDFLIRQPGTPLEPFYLEPPALDTAVRLVRMTFTRRVPRVAKLQVRIVSCEVFEDAGGLVVNHHLRASCVESLLARRRKPPMHFKGSQLVAGMVGPRLQQFRWPGSLLRVVCRITDGYRLTLQGEIPWRNAYNLQTWSTVGDGKTLESLELAVSKVEEGLCVHTTTAESVIRFSACMARRERMVLRESRESEAGRVVIPLRDFDGDEAELPAIVSYADVESWLRGYPALPLHLREEDRLAIARWAYPPEAWLTNEFLEKLL